MKIGFDAKRAYFNKSGLGNYSRFLLDALARFQPINEYYYFVPKPGGTLFSAEVYNNCHEIYPKGFIDKLASSYWRSYSSSKQASNLGIELYHGLSGEIPYKISKRGIKSVVTIHDLIFMRYPELYKPTDRKIYEMKARNACEQADLIVAISEQTKEDIVRFLGTDENKIKVIYQGCSHRFYSEASKDLRKQVRKKFGLPEKYLLYVGTVEQRKNVLSVVKALHRGHINMPLIIVGKETEYVRTVRHYIDRNGMKNIHFLSGVEDKDLPPLYQMAEVFVYPSIFEGFGIPILEALYSKTPVITNSEGCFREAGGPSSLYVNPLNSEEIAEAIKKVIQNKEYRDELILNGYRHAQKFNPETLAGELMKVYKSV